MFFINIDNYKSRAALGLAIFVAAMGPSWAMTSCKNPVARQIMHQGKEGVFLSCTPDQNDGASIKNSQSDEYASSLYSDADTEGSTYGDAEEPSGRIGSMRTARLPEFYGSNSDRNIFDKLFIDFDEDWSQTRSNPRPESTEQSFSGDSTTDQSVDGVFSVLGEIKGPDQDLLFNNSSAPQMREVSTSVDEGGQTEPLKSKLLGQMLSSLVAKKLLSEGLSSPLILQQVFGENGRAQQSEGLDMAPEDMVPMGAESPESPEANPFRPNIRSKAFKRTRSQVAIQQDDQPAKVWSQGSSSVFDGQMDALGVPKTVQIRTVSSQDPDSPQRQAHQMLLGIGDSVFVISPSVEP
jgi:hypothetical protein